MKTIFYRPITGEKRTPASPVVDLSWILIAIGVGALSYVAWVAGETILFQKKEIQKLETANVTKQIKPSRSPSIHIAPQPGSVLGRLQIRQLGLEAVVVEGDSHAILRHAVGHIPTTPLPGQFGNVALAGHRDTFFRSLRLIRPHDIITFSAQDQELEYEVESTRVVPPTDIGVLARSTRNQLTLVTCYPFNYIGAAPDRFVVVGKQIAQGPQP